MENKKCPVVLEYGEIYVYTYSYKKHLLPVNNLEYSFTVL